MTKLATDFADGMRTGLPFIATEQNVRIGKRDDNFRCTFCGYRFETGDVVRCQHTNDTSGAGGNPKLCEKCDRPKEEVVKEMKRRYELARGEMWWWCYPC